MILIIKNLKGTALNCRMMIIEDLQSILKKIWNCIDTHLKTILENGGMIKIIDRIIIKIITIKIIIKNIKNGKEMDRKYNHKVI